MSQNWTDILGNVASGGVLGLLGNAVSFGLNYFKNKQEHGFAIERMRLEGELQSQRTAGDVAVARESGAAAAFTASVEAEGKIRGESRWVTNVRAMVRPVITGALVVITCGIWCTTDDPDIAQFVSTNIVVTSVASITWWFGQRSIDRTTVSWGAGRVSTTQNGMPK